MTEPSVTVSNGPVMPSSTSLASPARLIAEIPAILGFHPANSAIFLLLRQVETNTMSLGPVLRMDAGDAESLPQFTKCINSFAADIVFAVVSSEKSHHAFVSDIVQSGIDNLDIVWHVRGVSEDEPYTALWTDQHDFLALSLLLAGEFGSLTEHSHGIQKRRVKLQYIASLWDLTDSIVHVHDFGTTPTSRATPLKFRWNGQ